MSNAPQFPHHYAARDNIHRDRGVEGAAAQHADEGLQWHAGGNDFPDARSAYDARGEVVLPQHYEEVPVDPNLVDKEWISGTSAVPLGGDGFLQWANKNQRPANPDVVWSAARNQRSDGGGFGSPTDLSPMRLTSSSNVATTPSHAAGGAAASPLALQSRAVDNLLFSAQLIREGDNDLQPKSRTTEANARRGIAPITDIFAYTRLDCEAPAPNHMLPPQPPVVEQQQQQQGDHATLTGQSTPSNHEQQLRQRQRASALERRTADAGDDVFRTAPEDTPGFNDPRLVARLQHLIQDRLLLEQYLLLQDEHHEMEDLVLRESIARRALVFQNAFSYNRCATEQMQRSALDALMVRYATTDYVPQTRAALMQRIEIAQTELDEINEAVDAVRRRTDVESMDAEDELVDVLTKIRTERGILMEQLQHAEERRAKHFEAQKDPFIEQNFSDVQVSRSGSSSVSGGHIGSSPLASENSQRRHGKHDATMGTPSYGAAVFARNRMIPKDLWVAKTLPAARRTFAHLQEQAPPSATSGGHHLHHASSTLAPLSGSPSFTAARQHIDALFPMPPLRSDLDAIQRAYVPKPSASMLTAATAANVGDRVVPAAKAPAPAGTASQRQSAAAYYQSFLAAAASPAQGGGKSSDPLGEGNAGSVGAAASSGDVIRRLSHNLLDSAAVLQQPGSGGSNHHHGSSGLQYC